MIIGTEYTLSGQTLAVAPYSSLVLEEDRENSEKIGSNRDDKIEEKPVTDSPGLAACCINSKP